MGKILFCQPRGHMSKYLMINMGFKIFSFFVQLTDEENSLLFPYFPETTDWLINAIQNKQVSKYAVALSCAAILQVTRDIVCW